MGQRVNPANLAKSLGKSRVLHFHDAAAALSYRDQFGYALPGWRKAKDWRRQLKACERLASQIVYRGGPNKEARMKRAVRDYLASRGIAPQRMRTISYGKERPVAVCNDISCWSQNRRVVTVLNTGA